MEYICLAGLWRAISGIIDRMAYTPISQPLQLEVCSEAVSGVSIFSKGKIIIFDDRLRGVLQSLEPLTVSGTKRSTFSSTKGKPHRLRLFDGYSVTGGELLQLIE